MKHYAIAKSSFIALFLFGGVCPLCIPKVMAIASLFGVSLYPTESIYLKILFHITFIAVCFFSFGNYRKHGALAPFILTVVASVYLIAFSHLFPKVIVLPFWTLWVCFGILLLAAVLDYYYCRAHKVTCAACTPESNATRSKNKGSCCS